MDSAFCCQKRAAQADRKGKVNTQRGWGRVDLEIHSGGIMLRLETVWGYTKGGGEDADGEWRSLNANVE